MIVHLHLFQILLLHIHSQTLLNANIVTELAMLNITILIFIHVSTVIKLVILQTDASETNLVQEQRFILDGSLLGNGLQQPRRYFAHTKRFVLEYWKVFQLRSLHLLTLYLTGGEMIVIYKLQSHIKRAWATTCHTRFKFVARDKDALEHAFSRWYLFKELGTLPLAEDFNFLPVSEESQELH